MSQPSLPLYTGPRQATTEPPPRAWFSIYILLLFAVDVTAPPPPPPPLPHTHTHSHRPPLGDDGTPSESLGDLFVRVRNVISILETSYQDVDVVLVSPSSDVLSVLLAAANGKDLRQHAEYALGPAQFAILDLVPRYAAAPEQGLGAAAEPATTAASEPAAAIAAVRADDRADVSSSY
ncbi:hypothetical protein T492DRAFT_480025 [Pavlovales sp. CCMP2436]|nr:hypothetical protein T492DRAFT_480025 [Pavlovales sp. CCMP2436]